MAISDLLPRLLELLGLKASGATKFRNMERSLLEKKTINEDRLEELKDRILRIERQALAKKREYDTVKGDRKRIVKGEIERLFQALDRCRGQEDILARNLEQVGLGLAKVAEVQAAVDSGVEESVFDELTLELQDIFGQMKAVDQEAAELEATKYASPRSESIDINARMAALEAEVAEPESASRKRKPATREGLSQSAIERCEELASED